MKQPRTGRRAGGFTLVEVLVALLMMALLTGLSWQALDGVLRARDDSRVSIDRTVRLSAVLTQWEQDLLALHETLAVPALSFDGQTLRLTRRTEGGVMLVAWAVRGGQWQRWATPPFVRTGELQEAWLRSQQLQGGEPGTVVLTEGAGGWQIYFARGGRWSNAQSTGDLALPIVAPPPATPGAPPPPPQRTAREALPEAVRLLVTLGERTLTRDIALGPTGS
ncbi:MAG: general secretion pathway protein GspJ [Leptothrix sp. (in: Bacteria)]|nr:general secretion pathway protein GspJ [Leptothrix sp. (in: b-proteobacteria)]